MKLEVPKPCCVVTRYCSDDLRITLTREEFGWIDPMIASYEIYPTGFVPIRVDLVLREIDDPGVYWREANVLELAFFALKHAYFVGLYGPIRGRDERLEAMGKEIGSRLTIPHVSIGESGLIEIRLAYPEPDDERFMLVVTDEIELVGNS